MTIHEKNNSLARLSIAKEIFSSELPLRTVTAAEGSSFDPELLYVECHNCGKPVLWEQGKTTALLAAAGVDLRSLDERCMIVSEGCPSCRPLEQEGFTLAVVRIAGLTPEEAIHMTKPAGTA